LHIRPCELAALALLGAVAFHAEASHGAGRPARVSVLLTGPADCKPNLRYEAFRRGLAQAGLVPDKNIRIERRCYRNATEMQALLREMIDARMDVVVVGVPAAAIAARRITRETPIVCVSCGDPLDFGLVESLARPGGNVTGIASLSAELIGKRLELLKQVVPQATRLAAFINPDNPGTQANLRALDRGAPALGYAVQRYDFRKPDDFEPAFRAAAAAGMHAVLVQDDPFSAAGAKAIGQLSLKHRLPVIAGIPELADAGALVAYGPDRHELHRRAAFFVDKILHGTRPGDLPIEQASTFDLVINARTAAALGVPLAQVLLSRASRVIQ